MQNRQVLAQNLYSKTKSFLFDTELLEMSLHMYSCVWYFLYTCCIQRDLAKEDFVTLYLVFALRDGSRGSYTH